MSAIAFWARHKPARRWCAIIGGGDSLAKTACRGMWALIKGEDPVDDDGGDLVETHPSPLKIDRCPECERQLNSEAA